MRVVAIVVIALLLGVSAAAQTSAPATGTIAPISADGDLQQVTDFRKLFEERETLVDQRRDLEKEIDDLNARAPSLAEIKELENKLSQAEIALRKAERAKRPESELAELRGNVETARDELREAKSPLLQSKRQEYGRAGRRLFTLEQRIASLFDASRDVNRFRTNVTYTFGVLVFVVIVGFYIIAWYKQGVATTIFSGAMGMQFVTLFLIVIAIILFGIMGTLEGKELAALLGGLSGYILGRADSRRAAAEPEPSPKP